MRPVYQNACDADLELHNINCGRQVESGEQNKCSKRNDELLFRGGFSGVMLFYVVDGPSARRRFLEVVVSCFTIFYTSKIYSSSRSRQCS